MVAGLVASAVKVSLTLSNFVSSVSDAPATAEFALAAADGMRLALLSVEHLC